MNAKHKKPWLGPNGRMRPDSELKKICGSWTLEQWNEYLLQFELDQINHIQFEAPTK